MPYRNKTTGEVISDEEFSAHYSSRIPLLRQEVKVAQQESQKGVARRFGTEALKEIPRQLFQAPARLAASAAFAPIDIARGALGRQPIQTRIPFLGKTFQAEAADTAGQIIEGEKPLYSALRPFGEVPLAGLQAAGIPSIARGIKLGAQVGRYAGRGILENIREDRAIKAAFEATKPVLSKAGEQAAKQAGRVSFEGRKVVLAPNKKDIEVAHSVTGLIKSGIKNTFENIQAIRGKIAQISEEGVRAMLKKNDAIFNTNQLRTRLAEAKEESRVVFGSDKTLEGAYDSVIDEFVRIVNKKPKKVSNLYEARIELDKIMKQKFGPDILKIEKVADKPRANAILDIRRAGNKYISELLPEGNPYGFLLKEEANMYEAIRRIAGRAPKIGTKIPTRTGRFFRAHPTLKGVAIGTGATIGLGSTGATIFRALHGD